MKTFDFPELCWLLKNTKGGILNDSDAQTFQQGYLKGVVCWGHPQESGTNSCYKKQMNTKIIAYLEIKNVGIQSREKTKKQLEAMFIWWDLGNQTMRVTKQIRQLNIHYSNVANLKH